jgi:hypothetical protein
MDVVTGGRDCPINTNKHTLQLIVKNKHPIPIVKVKNFLHVQRFVNWFLISARLIFEFQHSKFS